MPLVTIKQPTVPPPYSASFETSLVPMLIADDRRRYVAANRAACLLLRLSHDEVVKRTIDDLTPPDRRRDLDQMWESFLRERTQAGTFELLMPDGPTMQIEYSATAHIEPGRHLSILVLPTVDPRDQLDDRSIAGGRLTDREREVLTLIAMGHSGAAIAAALHVSPSTVESHVRHCLAKLGARNRAHAIALGLEQRHILLHRAPTVG